ncbi:unnamed protein product [Ectocarpus sp. 8 AP-2014]
MSGSCRSPGWRTGSTISTEAWPSWDGASGSVVSQDPPGFLRMYIRWDEDESVVSGPATVHRYILHYFLEDGTIEMRELADIKGGNYFEGRFPVMIRRQKVFKGGSTPSLSVDRIGGDRAVAAASTTPRSARANGGGGSSGIGGGGSFISDGGGAGGRGGGDDLGDDLGETLSPLDLIVGRQVLLMKRPMVVCGWDETAHVWWENVTGTNMRGLQGDLEDFQRCTHPGQSQPRPPNKPKSSFYEGPPQRTGTLRERFFKASENSGKTLRFLAKATQDTKTTSTRDNVFIIRFYPEDDALSVYTSHNLGKNAGGLYRGVYLARSHDMVNEATGKPFKARDFHIGSVAKLPSVSLEIVDVDDFSRHYLARETSPSDSHWQTAPMWSRLLALATAGGAEVTESAEARATAGAYKHVGFHPFSPDESTAFEGTEGDGAGAAEESLQPSDNDALEERFSHENHAARGSGGGGGAAATIPATSALGATNACSSSRDNHGGDSGRSSAIFARLWAEVIGDYDNDDDARAAFPPGDRHNSTPGGGAGENRTAVKKNSASSSSSSSSSSPQQSRAPSPWFFSSSSKNHRQQSLDPWERLVAALREDRGVDVSRALTAHEHTLLQREVADWLQRARAGPRGGGGGGGGAATAADGRGKGMAARLAAAATAALNMKDTAAPAPAAAVAIPRQTRVVGGPRDDARGERLSVGGFSFPAVVVEGEGATPAMNGGGRHPRATSGEEPGAGAANGGPRKRLERQLDLRGVVLDAHEAPATGRDDKIVRRALARVQAQVFCQGGEVSVLRALKAEGKTPGDAADLWTTCRLLKIVAELSRRETEGLWLKFMPAAVEKAGDGGRVTFAGFLESIKTFEACLRRGELLGLTSIGRNGNCAGPLVEETSKRKQIQGQNHS